MDLQHVIAIVGMGCAFPDADTPEAFWELVRQGRDTVRPVTKERWGQAPTLLYESPGPSPDKAYSLAGCFVDDASLGLDWEKLTISPERLGPLDPLFKVGLYAAQQAWLSAKTERVSLQRVGVLIGNIVLPSQSSSALTRESFGEQFKAKLLGETGSESNQTHADNRKAAGLPAGFIAEALGLGGSCATLDAACASSLYAIHLAVQALREGKADAMISGGLSRPDCLYTQMGFSQLKALSSKGWSSPFDEQADGLIVGEGAGFFVLKRLSDALEHGDTIHGVIAGTGLSNDRDGSLLAPSSEGQLRAMRAAYAEAGWQPDQVAMIECHATGTPLGDRVEFESLQELWAGAAQGKKAVIGSVKSNIGHLLTAAGAASLMKVLLALRHKEIPPTARFQRPGTGIYLEKSPFRVLQQAEAWSQDAEMKAAVSAFGFGGINAHLLVQAFDEDLNPQLLPEPGKDKDTVVVVGMAARIGSYNDAEAVARVLLGLEKAHAANGRPSWLPPGAHYHAIDQVDVPLGAFRIPPNELKEMLPQQLLILELTRRAINHCKLSAKALQNAGVFLGIGLDPNTANFQLRWGLENQAQDWAQKLGLTMSPQELATWIERLKDQLNPALNASRVVGALGGMVASRVAREYRVGGPSFTFSAEEHSGIAALEAAVQGLQAGRMDAALVGAVEFGCDPRTAHAELSQGAEAVNDGGMVLVLKRLGDALRDGDTIYSRLGAIETTHSTAAAIHLTSGETTAVESGQKETKADKNRLHLSVETAPSLKAFGGNRATAGLFQVLAGIMALHYRVHSENGRPQYWLRNRRDGARKASVTTESSDGSTGRIELEEHLSERTVRPLVAPAFYVIFLTGASREVLLLHIRELQIRTQQPGADLAQISQDWWQAKKSKPQLWRVGFLVRSLEKLINRLDVLERALEEHPENPGEHAELSKLLRGKRVFFSSDAPVDPHQVAFVFPGSGSQFSDMGRLLGLYFPQVFDAQDRVTEYFRDQLRPDLFWKSNPGETLHDQHRALLSAQVALGVLTHDVVKSFGVNPRAVIGYSLGESSALFATRAWNARDEMHCRTQDSMLFKNQLAGRCDAAREVWQLPPDQPVDWVLGVVNRPQAAVREALKDRSRVYLLIVNTPNECVIGGAREEVMALVAALEANLFQLHGVVTVHCEVLEPAAKAYYEHHLFETRKPEGIDFYSGGWGERFEVSRENAANAILGQARHGVDFPKTIRAAYTDGYRVFVEMGPGGSCTRMIGEILKDQPHHALSVSRPGPKALRQFLRSMAHLYCLGLPVDVGPLFEGKPPRGSDREVQRTLRIIVNHQIPEPEIPQTKKTVESKPMIEMKERSQSKQEPKPPAIENPEKPLVQPSKPENSAARSGGPWLQSALEQMTSVAVSNHLAHEAFLRVSQLQAETLQQVAQFHVQLAAQAGLAEERLAGERNESPSVQDSWETSFPKKPDESTPSRHAAFDRNLCLEFARGSIGSVLGPEFAEIDLHPTRVRLPDEPLMLVDRILHVEGERMKHGRVVTEHDVKPNGWYLDGGRIPTCVAVEAGQADLFLSAYLGIDFETKGHAVYRLLDAEVTFHDDLPQPGEVIHYDIHIDNFFRQGQTYLFRFRFDGTVNGKPLLTMRNGCAGFFSEAELDAGKGIVRNPRAADLNPHRGEEVLPLVPMQVESYSDAQLIALRNGDLAACFGPEFAQLPLQRPMTLPDGVMNLVDRVLVLEPQGGPFGLGFIRAEADIHPDDWFLTCHFVDDKVMPGTLMYECCLHSLRIYLLRMGWIGEQGQVSYQPIVGIKSRLKCRGQVLETTKKVRYEIMIKALGYNPEPYAIVDALMYSDEKCIVEIGDMSIRLSGLTREAIESLWEKGDQPGVSRQIQKPALFDSASILAFAVGNPSEAFGEPYRIFDRDRIIARLPGPPLMLTDRITALGTPAWQVQAGGTVQAQYDVPRDAWYFQHNQQNIMPFAVLLEIALQPCGWMAAYMGSALTSDQDLKFRNLGGSATILRPVTCETGTLTIDITCTKVSASGGMIIQNFDFLVSDGAGPVYEGDTYFGFFSKEALAKQVGLRNAVLAGDEMKNLSPAMEYPSGAPYPSSRMRMLDRIVGFHPRGGEAGLGYILGEMDVDPTAWFFKAHFHQDPVVPGSLGLESFLQLLKVAAVKRWNLAHDAQFETVARGIPHTWEYRGQVIPTNQKVTVEATLTAVDEASKTLRADGILSVDGTAIYRMKDFSLRVV